MNLHVIASNNISAVNPRIPVTLQISTGYTTSDDGSRVPVYTYIQEVPAQIQPLTYDEIRFIDGLEIQGEKRGFYLGGRLDGINRSRNFGGSLILYPDGIHYPYGTTWKIVIVTEQWPDWCKVVGTLQNQFST